MLPRPQRSTLSPYTTLFRSLAELGYIEGQTLAIESRYADSRAERLPDLASELVALNLDVLVTTGINRSEEHTSELQSPCNLVCRHLLEKKKETYRDSQQRLY